MAYPSVYSGAMERAIAALQVTFFCLIRLGCITTVDLPIRLSSVSDSLKRLANDAVQVEMIHNVKAPDLSAADAPSVCQSRRVAKDLKETWPDIMRLLDTANDKAFLDRVGPGFFSDLDMLEVGHPGNCDGEGSLECPGLTDDEQAAHFSLWAAFKSPLVIGADPRKLSAKALALLLNEEILEVNQDMLAKPVRLLSMAPNHGLLRLEKNHVGTKLKMIECDGSVAQRFSLDGGRVQAHDGRCMTGF